MFKYNGLLRIKMEDKIHKLCLVKLRGEFPQNTYQDLKVVKEKIFSVSSYLL